VEGGVVTRSTTRRDAITPYAAGEEEVVEIMLAPFRRAAPGGEDADCAPRNTRGWRKFAELINTAWRKGAGAFLEVGRHLIQAKEELDRDEYDALVRLRLAFDASTAKKLICIGQNRLLGAHVHLLPPCWSTLYELTKLEDEVLQTDH
jgi:hypothetical protein